MFLAQNDKIHNQKLKMQEVNILDTDAHIISVDGLDVLVNIGETITKVVFVSHYNDIAQAVGKVPAAQCLLENGSDGTINSVIRVVNFAMATDDVLKVCYITKN